LKQVFNKKQQLENLSNFYLINGKLNEKEKTPDYAMERLLEKIAERPPKPKITKTVVRKKVVKEKFRANLKSLTASVSDQSSNDGFHSGSAPIVLNDDSTSSAPSTFVDFEFDITTDSSEEILSSGQLISATEINTENVRKEVFESYAINEYTLVPLDSSDSEFNAENTMEKDVEEQFVHDISFAPEPLPTTIDEYSLIPFDSENTEFSHTVDSNPIENDHIDLISNTPEYSLVCSENSESRYQLKLLNGNTVPPDAKIEKIGRTLFMVNADNTLFPAYSYMARVLRRREDTHKNVLSLEEKMKYTFFGNNGRISSSETIIRIGKAHFMENANGSLTRLYSERIKEAKNSGPSSRT